MKRNRGRPGPPARRAAGGASGGSVVQAPPVRSVSSVASDERTALLARAPDEDDEEQEQSAAMEETGSGSADPTQKILTTLGRFQRAVAKGQTGAQQELWSDDCMDQLISAVEISMAREWASIVEALTDTARILHSYEAAGCAHLCVPFLNDSYEILCLMASDLIVDNVRSGVIDKWRERYGEAVEELKEAGLTLVEDEEGERPARAQDPRRSETPREPVVTPFDLPFVENGESSREAGETPSFDEFVDVERTVDTSSKPEAVEETESAEAAERPAEASDTEKTPDTEEASSSEEPAAEAAVTFAEEDETRPESSDVGEATVDSLLDALCDGLAGIEKDAELDTLAHADLLHELLAELRGHAKAAEHADACQLCDRMGGVVDQVLRVGYKPSDRFFDVAYTFCEAYVEANAQPEGLLASTWMAEAESLIEEIVKREALGEAGEAAVVPAPGEAVEEESAAEEKAARTADEPAGDVKTSDREPSGGGQETADESDEEPIEAAEDETPPGPEKDTPESYLLTAQRAMARGDLSAARQFALQAAAHVALVETEKAEAWVREGQARLDENAQAIEQVQAAVREAEIGVKSAARNIKTHETHLREREAAAGEIAGKLDASESRVAAIDEQIRALEAQRDAEMASAEAIRRELEAARGGETEAEAALAQSLEQEQAARDRLQQVRRNVESLAHKRGELEGALARAHKAMARQKTALEEIEQTIRHFSTDGEDVREE